MELKIHFREEPLHYDGSQLRPHWILKNFGLFGDALISFRGGCRVAGENLVDLEDRLAGRFIRSEGMLHFIGEFFGRPLAEAILLQRLLVACVQQEVVYRAKIPTIIRAGNDLYDEGKKLSVSIATASPVSSLLHFGINIVSAGTPVPTKGLADYGIEPAPLARSVLETFQNELATLEVARAKVVPVREGT